VGLLFFYALGAYPLFDPDEPRYAEASRQIALYGDWITPHFNGLIRLEKPPFFYWLAALSYKTFGISEWSARFPSGVLAFLTVGMSGLLTHWCNGWKKGLLSGLVLATSILFLGIARMSITDMTLTTWLSGAGFSLYLVAHNHRRWWLAAGAFIGLALLTKGPIGIALPVTVIGLYSLWTRQFRTIFLTRWMPLGLGLACLIAMPWYIWAYQANGDFFLQSLFWNNVTRYSSVVSGHKQPGWYYIAVLLIGFMPWTFFLPAAVMRLLNKRFWVLPLDRPLTLAPSSARGKEIICSNNVDEEAKYSPLINNTPLPPQRRRNQGWGEDTSSLLRYCILWAGFVFTFFMMGQTRLPTYILPMFPPLAIAFALLIPNSSSTSVDPAETQNASARSFKAWISGGLLSTLVSVVGSLILISQYSKLLQFSPAQTEESFPCIVIIAVTYMLSNMIALILLIKRQAITAMATSCAGILVISVCLWGQIIPTFAINAQAETMSFLQKVGQAPLAVYDLQRPSLTYYGKRNVPRFSSQEGDLLLQWLQKQTRDPEHIFAYIILREHRIQMLQNQLHKLYPTSTIRIQRIESGSKYNLISILVSHPQLPKLTHKTSH